MDEPILDTTESSPVFPPRARIALAHDWLCSYRGGEAVLERIARIAADEHELDAIYTMFDSGQPLSETVDRSTRIAWEPGRSAVGVKLRRWLLPLYPRAVGGLSRALARRHADAPIDLLISTSSAAIKSLNPPPGVPHLCYCHAPARYIWSLSHEYAGGIRGLALDVAAPFYRHWDRKTAGRVTTFVANSTYTASQIRRCFGRDSVVVHPPVRTNFFAPDPGTKREGFWLIAGAIEPYKRVGLAIEAALLAGKELVVVGEGSSRSGLQERSPPNVRFLGRVDDDRLRALYRRAAVLLFPQIEDFGIVAVEAQACSCPVAARAVGGAVDTVIDGETGALFTDPTPSALAEAAARAEACAGEACRRNAERFSEIAFDAAMQALILNAIADAGK